MTLNTNHSIDNALDLSLYTKNFIRPRFHPHGFKIIQVFIILISLLRVTSHTRLNARDITLQVLSLVEKAEPIQVRFTLCLRDQLSK